CYLCVDRALVPADAVRSGAGCGRDRLAAAAAGDPTRRHRGRAPARQARAAARGRPLDARRRRRPRWRLRLAVDAKARRRADVHLAHRRPGVDRAAQRAAVARHAREARGLCARADDLAAYEVPRPAGLAPALPTAAPPRAPMPASFAALTTFSLRVRSGPLISSATRLHSAMTDWGGTPLEAGAAVDGAGAEVVGACATLALGGVIEGEVDGATT